jgi:hypothetical protein
MGDTADLAQDSDFLLDMCRFAEGIYSEAALRKKYRLAEDDWVTLGEDDDLVRRIEAERLRRVRDGSCKRERAQHLVVDAPRVLGDIMLDDKASPKHRIDSAKVLDGLAANGPQNVPAADRFIITINLGSDTEHYSKSITVTADDPDDINGTPEELVAIVATDKPTDGGGNGNAL